MAESTMQEVIMKAVAEEDFRTLLLEDPENAVKQGGFDLSDEEMARLKEIDKEELAQAMGEVDERISKAAAAKVIALWI